MKDGQREKENRTFPDASAATAITNHFKRRTKAGAIFAAAVTTALWFYYGLHEKFNTLEDFLSLIRI